MPKLLFLAQFAPTNDILLSPPKDEEEKFYANTYHSKVVEILERSGYDFHSTSDVNHLIEKHSQYDLVWSLYNRIGFRNSEIFVQSLCEYYGLKYIGASPNIRAMGEDKSMAKQMAQHIGLLTPDWVNASKNYPPPKFPPFEGAYFVKPRFGSASIGIDESCICATWNDVVIKSNEYFQNNIENIIIEKFIDGYCYGVPIINNPIGEMLLGIPHFTISEKSGNVMTYNQKRRTETGLSTDFSEDKKLNNLLEYLTKKYFLELQPCDYARLDFLVDKKTGVPYFLEVNILMNLGVKSGFTKSMLKFNFKTYEDIILHILRLGFSKIN